MATLPDKRPVASNSHYQNLNLEQFESNASVIAAALVQMRLLWRVHQYDAADRVTATDCLSLVNSAVILTDPVAKKAYDKILEQQIGVRPVPEKTPDPKKPAPVEPEPDPVAMSDTLVTRLRIYYFQKILPRLKKNLNYLSAKPLLKIQYLYWKPKHVLGMKKKIIGYSIIFIVVWSATITPGLFFLALVPKIPHLFLVALYLIMVSFAAWYIFIMFYAKVTRITFWADKVVINNKKYDYDLVSQQVVLHPSHHYYISENVMKSIPMKSIHLYLENSPICVGSYLDKDDLLALQIRDLIGGSIEKMQRLYRERN